MEIDDTYVEIPMTAEEVIRDRQNRKNAERAARQTVEATALTQKSEDEEVIEDKSDPQITEPFASILRTEASQAIQRLKAKDWPGGELREVVTHYSAIRKGWLQKRIDGYEQHTVERAVWPIDYGARAICLYLGSDSILYFYSIPQYPGQNTWKSGFHAIESEDSDFFNPAIGNIEDRVEKIVRQLRLLGTD